MRPSAVMEEVRELQKRLADSKARLKALEETVAQRPEDDVLIKLRDDLRQVVSLTQSLLKAKVEKTTPTISTTPSERKRKEWEAGDYCQAKWSDGKWYYARIDSVSRTGPEASYHVFYLEYGNEWDVSQYEMRQLLPLDKTLLVPGAQCKALYHGDGLLYDAEIMRALGEEVFRIKFSRFGNEGNVGVQDILVVSKKRSRSESQEEEPKKAAVEMTSEFLVPESLRILPTDSEEVKENKRKRIKSLKNKHRVQKLESEHSQKQSSWQAFRSGIGAQRKVGFMSSTVKDSIFRSPDNPEGKVGVVGSGKPMTSYKTLGKYKLDAQGNRILTEED